MNTTHTPGPWAYDENRNAIYSTVEFIVEPDKEQDEEGIPVDIISTRAAMGGNDTKADIKLLTAAPDMLAALIEAKKLLESVRHRMPKSIRNSESFHFENILANSIGKAIQKATQP